MLTTNTASIEDLYTSGAYPKRPLTLVRGRGSLVWDDAGNEYIDATSGQGVALLGHNHPAIVAAIRSQTETLTTCPEIFYNEKRAELYQLLAEITPGDLNRFFLCNSGAEAIEGALKVSRLLTARNGIVAMKQGFHGRTLGALALTWNRKYRELFEVWQPDVTHISYNGMDAARDAISEDTAAVVVEPLQGEGGVHPIEGDYLRELRRLCDERGALLIIDEIQTGFGRTGKWFGFQHTDILPDVVALGKGIGGGVPMGAVCWRDSLGPIPRSTHGSTFGGNPLACAASIATITTLRDENIPPYANELGSWLINELRDLSLSAVREIRGQGLMVGLELRTRVTPVLMRLQDTGVLALPAGSNVLRLLPPLNITQDHLAVVINAVQEVLNG